MDLVISFFSVFSNELLLSLASTQVITWQGLARTFSKPMKSKQRIDSCYSFRISA